VRPGSQPPEHEAAAYPCSREGQLHGLYHDGCSTQPREVVLHLLPALGRLHQSTVSSLGLPIKERNGRAEDSLGEGHQIGQGAGELALCGEAEGTEFFQS